MRAQGDPAADAAPAPEIGRSRRRLEDERFLRGLGCYVDDIAVEGALWGHVLRSPMAHAAIVRIDVAAAAAMPGIVAVYTGADLSEAGIGPLPCDMKVATLGPLVLPRRTALAEGRVRHVGDPVAFVVAESAAEAREASEAIEVEYAELPAVVDMTGAQAPGSPLVWDEAAGNLCFRFERGDRAAVERAFAAAAATVELTLENNRVVVAPLETRAAIGRHDSEGDGFELILSGQGVHDMRRQLAETVFRVPPGRIRLVAPDVGGGFGVKNVLYPELVLVLFAARALGRPVRWTSDRSEDFLTSAQGRANRTRARLALDPDGRFLALEVSTDADMGAYLSAFGPAIPTNSASTAVNGVYDIPAVLMQVRGVFTNTVPVDAYRGAGKPESNYIVERLADLAARRLGLPPAELRRRNMIARFPHRSALGMSVERGAFASGLDAVLAAADQAGFAGRRAAGASRGRLRGFGLACFLETARGQPGEWAGIRFEPDGRVALRLGTQSNGQGHETSFPQIASDLLGLPVESFRYVQADTRDVPRGAGHGGARSLHQGGTALVAAIEAALAKGRRVAAHLLQSAPETLLFRAGRYEEPGTGRSIDLPAVAAAARDPEQIPAGMEPGLDSEGDTPQEHVTNPNGCHAAEVEIDPETGEVALLGYVAVDDYGTLVNPMLTEGQVQGGLAQGIGQALHERTHYEPGSGQLVTASFMDYRLPRAADLPDIRVRFNPVPSAGNPLGVKGSGQAGCIAAPQTIMSAILDALAPLGIEALDMPATPDRVWAAIRDARRRRPAGTPEAATPRP